jgi:hypothetical protein
MALRILITHAPAIGADIIFPKLIALRSSSGVLTAQERHSRLKANLRH